MLNGFKLKFCVPTYVNFKENLSGKNVVVIIHLTYLNIQIIKQENSIIQVKINEDSILILNNLKSYKFLLKIR